ncbi:peptidoglycan binding domain-containing protein [Nocardioidaceae bacterium SCSIO 66511]|nr:peptidoglycan binding domain-containing protein [Nocardioidaceae bacterium SCSIO 66511]
MTSKAPRSELKKRERRGTWFAIAGLVILLGGMYVAGHFLLGNRLPTGTRIGGVGVGGLTPEQAEERLNADLAPHTRQTLTFYHENDEYKIKPGDVGLELHIEQSVASAGGGRTWNPVDMLTNLVGNDRLDPVVTVDQRKLDAKIDDIASGIDQAPVEPRVRFDGDGLDVRRGEQGRKVHRADLEELIRTQFVEEHEDEAIPVVTAKPTVSSAELNAALSGPVKTAVGSPLRLRVADKTFKLSPAEVRSMVHFGPVDGRLAAKVDNDRFRELVMSKTKDVRRTPKPATVVIRGDRPKIVSDVAGRGVRTGGTARQVAKALERKAAAKRVVRLETVKRRAGFRTADAKNLAIQRKVASYTTRFRRGRGVDVGEIAGRIDDSLIRAGHPFSFNAAVREPRRSGGNGEGASQVATTLFNAGLKAGLVVPERHAHRTYVERLPIGRDAAVAYGGRNLRLATVADHPVVIVAYADAGKKRTSVHVEVWGSRRADVELDRGSRQNVRKPVRVRKGRACSPRSGVAGFAVKVRRTVKIADSKARSDSFSSSYAPVARIKCRGRR